MKNQTKPMTDRALVKRYESLHARMSKLIDPICDAGFGAIKRSEMRAEMHPLIAEYLKLGNESQDLFAEARRRYGPDLMFVKQLDWRDL